jgi:succinate-acetate transporter protein
MAKQKFDKTSPGWYYSLFVLAFTALGLLGIELPEDPAAMADKVTTTLSDGGIFAVVGILVSSIIFPVWNFKKKGNKFNVKALTSSTLFWVALTSAALSLTVLIGFTVPDGTAEQIILAVNAKDWGGLLSVLALNIVNPLMRYLKDRQPDTEPTLEG